ncbi:hypothetical protein ABKN59_008028 [Abortiporus biennis]
MLRARKTYTSALFKFYKTKISGISVLGYFISLAPAGLVFQSLVKSSLGPAFFTTGDISPRIPRTALYPHAP